jgi:5'-methylthioadenosine phosphorylase
VRSAPLCVGRCVNGQFALRNTNSGDIVVIDQYFDRLKQGWTFFDKPGLVAHVPFGDPICLDWKNFVFGIADEFCTKAGVKAFNGGTYVCMEGPQFSTRAESMFYRSLGAAVIGMTSLPEAKLSREAELSYSAISLVTDFDCWHVGEENVTADAVVAQMKRNIIVATDIVVAILERLDTAPKCGSTALAGGIMTAPHAIDPKLKKDLWPLIGHRLPASGH